MKWSWGLAVVLLTCGILSWGERGLEIPEYDGKDRVHVLTNKNYKTVMKKYDVMVIYYHKAIGQNRMARQQFEVEELALEVCSTRPGSVVLRVNSFGPTRPPGVKCSGRSWLRDQWLEVLPWTLSISWRRKFRASMPCIHRDEIGASLRRESVAW
ncbi:hypothetical protein NFI96_001103 [Prochilodus magdalenae]|nr:hypothetical protein NFI96_001103 [Prochilodus magdalenae]